MLFELWLLSGRTSVCPSCSGMLQKNISDGDFVCNDCRAKFRVKSEGQTDKSLVAEQI